MAKVYDTATDLITFARSSSGTALRRVGYGPELVDNNDFSLGDNGDWTKQLGWSIGGGVASYAPSTGRELTQTISTTAGSVYLVSFEITDRITGGFGVYSAESNVTVASYENSVGVYTVALTATGSSMTVRLRTMNTSTEGSIDNISVKEVIFDRATDDLVLFDHPDDIPRIEYAADGSLKGLLIEEQRTNLVTYSEDLTAWHTFSGETSVTLSSDTIYGVSAYEVTGSTGGFGLGRLSPNGGTSINLTSDGVLTFWAKKITAGTTLQYLWNGSVIIFDSQVPNDGQWHKVEITLAAANSALQLLRGFTSGTVALAMPQLEQGSFPTSYIPTSGGQKTRDPDIASIPVSAFGYNQEAGTFVADYTPATQKNQYAISVVRTSSYSDYMALLWGNAGTQVRFQVAAGSATSAQLNTLSGTIAGTQTVHAGAYAANDFAACNDGGAVLTDTLGDVPSGLVKMKIGGEFNQYLNGHIKSIQYYPRRLTDAQLQELTS